MVSGVSVELRYRRKALQSDVIITVTDRTDLDCNAKRWRWVVRDILNLRAVGQSVASLDTYHIRLVADVLNDLATFLELLAPHFPYFFLLFICAASVSKVADDTAVAVCSERT